MNKRLFLPYRRQVTLFVQGRQLVPHEQFACPLALMVPDPVRVSGSLPRILSLPLAHKLDGFFRWAQLAGWRIFQPEEFLFQFGDRFVWNRISVRTAAYPPCLREDQQADRYDHPPGQV